MPANQMFFQLPNAYRAPDILPLLSANAQIYVGCQQCGWEDRANPMYLRSAPSLLQEPCRQCHSTQRTIVLHAEQVAGRCQDCGHDLADTLTAPWLDLQCAACGSHRLEVQAITIAPPFPPRFGECGDTPNAATDPLLGMGKRDAWGIDPMADAEHINREVKWAVQMYPDSHLHILCATLLCQTLCDNSDYAGAAQFCWLVSLQGSLLRDYFRSTGDLAAGLEGLRLSERAVTLAPDAAARAAIEHNCAIDINSMLSQYDEAVVATAAGRPQIRADGIAAAQRALLVYEQEAAAGAPAAADSAMGAWQQVGRAQHLIGDLLRGGNAGQEQVRASLAHFDAALGCHLPEKFAVAVRQSRAEAVAALADATREQLLQAEQDLIAAIVADGARVARNFQWMRLQQLAGVARKLGAPGRELMALQQGAALALEQIRQNPEEWILQQRTERMSALFDDLALAYVAAQRPIDALDAAETLRAATVRVHTMDEAQRKQAEQARLAILARDLMPQAVRHLLPAAAQPPAPASTAQAVLGLLDYLNDKPSACLSYLLTPAGVTVFLCGPSGAAQPSIAMNSWPLDVDVGVGGVRWSRELVNPGPFRESNLKKMHAAACQAFFQPVAALLQQMKVERLVLSLPGALSRLAFEAFTDGSSFLLDRCEVMYLPSFALGCDLAQIGPRAAGGRLLVIGYQGDDLTHAAHEVAALRALFGQRMVLLSGAACNKTTVLSELGQDYAYIHFVCHGTYDSAAPLNAALHLVPEVRDDSQRVTAGDIMQHVRFARHPLVTLSACSTALMADSAVNNCHGLTGSFLRAGARAVIGSRWPVYDRTAAAFMAAFYARLNDAAPSLSPLHCLAEVQREQRASLGIEDFAAFGYMGIA